AMATKLGYNSQLSTSKGGFARSSSGDARWRNIYRNTDFLGSWLFHEKKTPWPHMENLESPISHRSQEGMQATCLTGVDQLILDPPRLLPKKNPYVHTFQFNRHSSYFPDPQAHGVATQLMEGISWICTRPGKRNGALKRGRRWRLARR